jgi:hypothetical protein
MDDNCVSSLAGEPEGDDGEYNLYTTPVHEWLFQYIRERPASTKPSDMGFR